MQGGQPTPHSFDGQSHKLVHLSIPNEVTGSGLLRRRGWRWWVGRRISWLLFFIFCRPRYGRLVLEKVRGVPVIVIPGVFDPRLFLSTALLLDALAELPLGPDSSVLDLGTGTGVCAIFAAIRGARVTATDISPGAIRCARVNVALNDMEDRVTVLEGDLFLPVAGQRFDLVIFNPPFYEGKPRDWADYAWRGENVLGRFVEELRSHLAEGGRALLSVSTELDLSAIRKRLFANGFEVREVCRRRLPRETMFVYECIQSPAGGPLRSEKLGLRR